MRPTTTRPAFLMPVTLDAADPDVSAMITHYGHREGGVTRAVHEMLSGACVAPDSDQRRLVIVVGANFGYYPLYAAMYGCRYGGAIHLLRSIRPSLRAVFGLCAQRPACWWSGALLVGVIDHADLWQRSLPPAMPSSSAPPPSRLDVLPVLSRPSLFSEPCLN